MDLILGVFAIIILFVQGWGLYVVFDVMGVFWKHTTQPVQHQASIVLNTRATVKKDDDVREFESIQRSFQESMGISVRDQEVMSDDEAREFDSVQRTLARARKGQWGSRQ